MKDWNSLTLIQKCFYGLSKQEVLTKEFYEMLKDGKDFRTKNGVVEDIPIEVEITSDKIIIYTHKTSGVYIISNGAHIGIPYEDFYKGYNYVINTITKI